MKNKLINNAKAHEIRLIQSHHVHEKVHGKNLLGRINTVIAVCVTKVVGTMWCAYIFAVIALISLPAAIHSHDPMVIVSWVAQTFLQLVLLPIIIVGQNVLAEASDARAENDHETLMAIHTLTSEVHDITINQTQILKILEENLLKDIKMHK